MVNTVKAGKKVKVGPVFWITQANLIAQTFREFHAAFSRILNLRVYFDTSQYNDPDIVAANISKKGLAQLGQYWHGNAHDSKGMYFFLYVMPSQNRRPERLCYAGRQKKKKVPSATLLCRRPKPRHRSSQKGHGSSRNRSGTSFYISLPLPAFDCKCRVQFSNNHLQRTMHITFTTWFSRLPMVT